MAENVLQPVEVPVPLSLFGGLVTEMSPSDLPEGISPDCQDVVFFPGGIASRPGIARWLQIMRPGYTITYQKTYISPQGLWRNLFLLSDGSLWVQKAEDPSSVSNILNVTPGSYASSVSAFGKELITFHDTINGTDVPRIYDGNFIDRATQNAPASLPQVSNTSLPQVNMALVGAPVAVGITMVTPAEIISYGTYPNIHFYYATLIVQTSAPIPASAVVGGSVTISGNAQTALDGTFTIRQIFNGTTFMVNCNIPEPPVIPPGAGGTVTFPGNYTLQRNNNQVSCTTASPHRLQVGFQVQIAGVADSSVGGGIVSVVIDNETNPGIATVTTNTPHGLLPENSVKILGVANSAVGGAIFAATRSAQTVTITTTTPHGLQVGVSVLIAGVSDTSFDGQFVVTSIPGAQTFTYIQVDADAASSGGSTQIVWPVSDNSIIPNYYQVISTPTDDTFTVSLFYSDGTWNGGTVTFGWAGTFYVTQITSPTSFIYRQFGPNASTTDVGTVTPFSQIAPGTRSCVILYQTRQGFITAPSPPVQVITPGGQYLSITQIPIGPSNVIARIIAFTGADGQNFFYIPQAAVINGLQVSTSTVVNDNSTTSILIDFGDPTLFNSIAIDIPGNNQFAMTVLGPCLGVTSYASRAAWFGMRNSIQNLLNLGFDAGYNPAQGLSQPPGWTVETPGGTLTIAFADFGFAWNIVGTGGNDGQISQSAYQDQFSVAILNPNTRYSVSLKATVGVLTTGNLVVDLFSPTAGVLATGTLSLGDVKITPSLYTVDMDNLTPLNIPFDTVIRVYTAGMPVGNDVFIDDIEIFQTQNPTRRDFMFSYVNLPEQIDGVTSLLGSTDDDSFIQCSFIYRDALLFLTQTGLYETNDLAGSEPYNWQVRQVSRDCGAVGPFALTSGENFSAWIAGPSGNTPQYHEPPTGRGLYLYTGGAVNKLSQEIQPDFDNMSPGAQSTAWVCNDPVTRRVYMGIPTLFATAPDVVYIMDYREMDTASEIAAKSPIHISFTGKMICSDLSRKWTRWSIPTNRGDMMLAGQFGTQFSMALGTGQRPLATPSGGFSAVYYPQDGKYTDDDLGAFNPYYTTYFFINHEMEMNFQVGVHRKLYKRYSIYVQGLGNLVVTPYGDTLTNPWPVFYNLALSLNQLFDLGDSLNVIAERCAFKFSVLPLTGQTDVYFNINKFTVTMAQEPVAPIRFGAI